jgi:malate synthase
MKLLNQIVQESVEKFDTSYNERYAPMWGCCGGDYCEQSDKHNKRITDYIISSQISLLEAIMEVIEKRRENLLQEQEADKNKEARYYEITKFADYLQEQISEIKKLI